MNNLSENLKKIRKDNNLSQEQLAEKLFVSRQAISKWESGVAYPEMEKIIQICKMFDLNIDDFLNKDIREVKGEEEAKFNLNKYIDDFLYFITNTVNLFSSMSFKTKIKCLFEQALIIFILCIISIIIGDIFSSIFISIFSDILPIKFYYKLLDLFSGLYKIFIFGASIVILVHIFKVRYLDYYINIKNDKEINEPNDEKNKIIFKKKEDKIIIRDPKHSEYKFITGIFNALILFIKFFVLLFALCLCLLLVSFAFGSIISFLFIKTGILFIGLLLLMLSMSLGIIVIILLLFNFIFNRKNDKKKMIWTFLASIILFGMSCGLITIGVLKFDIVSEPINELFKTDTIYIDIDDFMLIDAFDIEYIEKDIDNIEIQYDVNKHLNVDYHIYYDYGKTIVYLYTYPTNILELIRTEIKEINNYRIIDINNDIYNIKIYTSRENIDKLKNNRDKYYDLTNELINE